MRRNGLRFLALSILILSGSLQAAGRKLWHVPLSAPSESFVYALSEARREVATPLLGQGWARYESKGQVRLVLDNGTSTPANEPALYFAYPWIGHVQARELILRIFNSSAGANAVKIAGRATDGTVLSQKLAMAPQSDSELSLREGLASLSVEGSDPLVSYLLWKEQGRIVWIDRGESTPSVGSDAQYALVLDGIAAAVQVQLQGAEISIERADELSDGISMTWRTEDETAKALWVASDLKPFQVSVLGIVHANAGAEPQIVESLASDSAGNRIDVNLRLQRIQ